MLKALLHRKIRLIQSDRVEDVVSKSLDWEGIAGREDPLTSVVFERLAYLDPAMTWEVLQSACTPIAGAALPERAPDGAPTWSFWPRLAAGEGGNNAHHVEPDVLIAWGSEVLLVEAKHAGRQWAGQWIEQIRAVREAPSHAGKRIWLIAAGGMLPGRMTAHTDAVTEALDDAAAAILSLPWGYLRKTAEDLRRQSSSSAASAILGDIAAALEAWGYRGQIGFDSLPAVAASWHIRTTPADLKRWRIQ